MKEQNFRKASKNAEEKKPNLLSSERRGKSTGVRQEKSLADTLKDVYKEFPKSIQCGCLLSDYQ